VTVLVYNSQSQHMHKAIPAFTIQHYISHTLLINFDYWSVSKTAKTKAAEFRSRVVSRPRPWSWRLQN